MDLLACSVVALRVWISCGRGSQFSERICGATGQWWCLVSFSSRCLSIPRGLHHYRYSLLGLNKHNNRQWAITQVYFNFTETDNSGKYQLQNCTLDSLRLCSCIFVSVFREASESFVIVSGLFCSGFKWSKALSSICITSSIRSGFLISSCTWKWKQEQ